MFRMLRERKGSDFLLETGKEYDRPDLEDDLIRQGFAVRVEPMVEKAIPRKARVQETEE